MMKIFALLKLMPLFWQGHAQDEDILIQMGKKNDMVLGSEYWLQLGSDIVGERSWDQTGYSVSISSDGSTVAIGAKNNAGWQGDNKQGNAMGNVRVYRFGTSDWVQLGSDIDGEAAQDQSGYSVSISGDGSTVAIGAYSNDDSGNQAGHVRVYRFESNDWVQLGSDIDGEAANDNSGRSVSISSDGSTVAIGAPYNDGGHGPPGWGGHVRVYRFGSSDWVQLGSDIDGEAAGDLSGWKISLSGDGSTVAIGAEYNDGVAGPVVSGTAGHVRVYRFGSSDWVQLGSDIDGEAMNDKTGNAVSISSDGSTVAVGTHLSDANGDNSGQVRVYRFGSSDWVPLGSRIHGEAANEIFGDSMSMSSDGSTVSVSTKTNVYNPTPSRVRVYRFGSSDWVKMGSDIDADAANDPVSLSISSDGSTVAIGASKTGHVRVYRFRQAATTTTTTITVATTSTTEAPPAGAYGDPHCVNAKGDWFDIHAVGRIPMVILPLGTSIEDGDFAVIATTTTPDGWDKCAPTFISAVDVWANQANDQLRVDAGPAGDLQVKPMNGSTEAYSIKMLSEKVMITFRSVIVSVILNKVPKIDRAPFLYFDMEVAGLQALKAGGILGADPHEFAQVQPDGCSEVPFKHRAVDRYSMARAMP